MQENYLNAEIYYRKNEFKPERLTLVFAHGVSGSSSAWLPYEKIFENKYNILTYDIRGHGLSKKFPIYSDYDIENFATDLHKLVNSLGISKFVLISNSFAALVALEYINKYRDTVVANVFTSPEVYLNEGIASKIFHAILLPLTFLVSHMPFDPKPRGQVNYKQYVGSTDWSIGRNWADMKNTSLRVHFFTLRKSLEFRHDYHLDKISVPSLIIHGEKDTMVPMKNAILLSKNIKNSEFVSIPSVDHNTVHNAVNAMSQAIDSFLERNGKFF